MRKNLIVDLMIVSLIAAITWYLCGSYILLCSLGLVLLMLIVAAY